MGANTLIEWATHTLNFWEGCTKVSEGCLNCYAAERDGRFHGGKHWGPGAPRRLTGVSTWAQADRWHREAEASGVRPRVFVNSLSDILDPEVPVAWLGTALQRMDETPGCDYLLVTKRPQLWRERLTQVAAVECDGVAGVGAVQAKRWLAGHAPANIWMGTTCENQARADERIPALLAIPAVVRFLSVEPLLGPVDLSHTCFNGADSFGAMPGIHWVIVGGESGKGARPMHPDWARSLRGQCVKAGVAFFFKQWGEWYPFEEHVADGTQIESFAVNGSARPTMIREGTAYARVGKAVAGRELDGREHNAIPEVRR